MKKFLLIMFICFMCSSCNKVIIDELPKDTYANFTDEAFEVYSDVTLKDLIKDTSIKFNADDIVKTTKVGENTYNWEFTYNKKNYLYHIKYKVQDTTSPKIFGGANKTFYIGNEQDICNLVMYGDNYDKNPVCQTDGIYDFYNPGKYEVKIIVTDESNNSANFNMTLNIINPPKESGGATPSQPAPKVDFASVYNEYKSDKTKVGIDVSRWQGDIDYNMVKNAGAEFVMMRIGVQQDLEEESSMDSKFLQNIKNAHEAGLDVGVYFYSMAMEKKEAISQAEWVIKSLKKEKLELPIVFDWENWSDWNSYPLSFHDVNEIADAFLETVKEAGYEGMLYSSKFYLQSIWENKKNYPVWVAHYTNNNELTDYDGEYLMWQMCSDGRIEGINSDVDIDVMFVN